MLLAAAFALGGCGSSDGGPPSKEVQASLAPPPIGKLHGNAADRAEAICRDDLEKVDVLARRLPEELANNRGPNAVTELLVTPGVRILNGEAKDLESLESAASPGFELFVGLFDPVIELAEQRVEAGNAGDTSRAHSLELLIAELQDEQSTIARRLGLKACAINFTEALGGRR